MAFDPHSSAAVALSQALQGKGIADDVIESVLPALVQLGARPNNLSGLDVSDLTEKGVSKLDARVVVHAYAPIHSGKTSSPLLSCPVLSSPLLPSRLLSSPLLTSPHFALRSLSLCKQVNISSRQKQV
jgi:hypothetical protein